MQREETRLVDSEQSPAFPSGEAQAGITGVLAFLFVGAAASVAVLLGGLLGGYLLGGVIAIALLGAPPVVFSLFAISRFRREPLAWEAARAPLPCPFLHRGIAQTTDQTEADLRVIEALERSPLGIRVPANSFVAIVGDAGALDKALSALSNGGLPADKIRTFRAWSGGQEPRIVPAASTSGAVGRAVRSMVVEEEPLLRDYWLARHRGANVLVVEAPREQAEDIAAVLGAYGAQRMRFFGTWMTTDLAPAGGWRTQQPALSEAPPDREETMVDPMELRRFDLFQDLAPKEVAQVSAIARAWDIPHGTILARQGEVGNILYFLVSGEVELTTWSPQGEVTVRIAGPGESFPLAALLEQGLLITTATAMSESVRALMIRSKDLAALCLSKPAIGVKIYKAAAETLGDRYRNTLTRLVDTFDDSLRQSLREPGMSANL